MGLLVSIHDVAIDERSHKSRIILVGLASARRSARAWCSAGTESRGRFERLTIKRGLFVLT